MNFGESRINELEKAEEFMVEVAIMSNKAFFAINFCNPFYGKLQF